MSELNVIDIINSSNHKNLKQGDTINDHQLSVWLDDEKELYATSIQYSINGQSRSYEEPSIYGELTHIIYDNTQLNRICSNGHQQPRTMTIKSNNNIVLLFNVFFTVTSEEKAPIRSFRKITEQFKATSILAVR